MPNPNPNSFHNSFAFTVTLTITENRKIMDSISNLPLLEITAEDDSLLFDAPCGGDDRATTSSSSSSSSAATSVFSCSPLLSLRSLPRTDGRVDGFDSEFASSETKDGVSNKENVNWSNKPEAPKLSVEPQQMKRKKGGGYNLRKSLAWNRAFFTEEGVLNPMELSMISGTATPKRTNAELKAIYEEEPASASSTLKEIEENLFKVSSDGGVCLEDRNHGAVGFTPKSGASTKSRASSSLAKRKVLAVNDVVGNISKRNACHQPVASSLSLRRPESAKAPNKESKVTKIPGPKSNVSAIKTAARSGTSSTGLPKRNQNAHPSSATNVQKYARAKGLLKNPTTASTNPKVDRADKCSVIRTFKTQAGKPLDSSVSETSRPLGLHPPGTGTKKLSAASLPQAVSDTIEKKQPKQFQTTKPSGLRMPSPSLGFFSQAKPSSSQNQLQKSSQPCKPAGSNIPKLRKLETHSVNEARLPPAPTKRSEIVEGATNNCTKKLSLSDVKSEPNMQVNNIQMAGVEVDCDSSDFEKIDKQEMVDTKQMAGLAVECHSLGLENPSGLLQHSVLGGSIQGTPYKKVEQMNDSAGDLGKLGGVSPAHFLNGNLSVNCNGLTQGTLEGVSQQLQGEQINTRNLNIVEEIISENENESQGNSCKLVHATTLSSECSPERTIPEINGACESEPKVAESEDCRNPVDEQLGFIQRSSMGEEYQIVDSIGLHDRTHAPELDRMCEDSTAVHVTTLSSKCSPNKPVSEMVSACESEPNVAESQDWQHLGDDQSGFIQRRPVDEGFYKVIDSKVTQNRTQAFELDRMCEDSTGVHMTTLPSKCPPAKCIPKMDNACESEPKVAESEDWQHPVDERLNQDVDLEGMNDRSQASELDSTFEDSTAIHVTTTLSSKCSPAESIPKIDGASETKVAESEDCQHMVDPQSDFIERKEVDEKYNQNIYSEVMNNRTQAFESDSMCEDSTAVHVPTLSSKFFSPAKSVSENDGASETQPKVAESEDSQNLVDHQSDFIERRAVNERCNLDIVSDRMNNTTQAFELDKMCEDSIDVSATVCSTEVNNISPESRPFYENGIENLDFAQELSSMVKADGDSSGSDKLISDHCTISEWQLRGDDSSMGNSVCYNAQCDVPGNCVQQTNTLSEQQLREDGSSMVTSMHFDVCRDVPGNFEQQDDSHTFSETNEMMCEDESLVANHVQLLDDSEYSGVAVVISNTEDSFCVSENRSGLLQHTVFAQSVRESDNTNGGSGESPAEDELAQSFVENPVVYNYENEHRLSATNDEFLLVDVDDKNDESHLSELQTPIVVENSQTFCNIMHLDGAGLPENTAYSEEIKRKDSSEGASEGHNIYTSEYTATNHHAHFMPESTDGNPDMDETVECLQMDDVKNGCTDILPEVIVQPDHKVISPEFDSSIKMIEDSNAEVVDWKSDEHCSTAEYSQLPASDNLPFNSKNTPRGSEVSPLNHKIISQEPEPETNIFEEDEFPNTDMQHQTKGDLCSEEDSSRLTDLENSATKRNPHVPPVKLPPNAVPFSEEWLAAIEAAGEEILTIKSGAVQNSPPEKPQHEPGPWSPVKRKNQSIGPFDCTKHTNTSHDKTSI